MIFTYTMRALVALVVLAPASLYAACIEPPFTHIWLSPFSTNPSFADTPVVNAGESVSLYLWARLPDAESISALSLRVASSGEVEFHTASLDNPSLGSRVGKELKRFEHVPAATIDSVSVEVHGFTIADRSQVGAGLTPATRSIDPLYDPAVDAWRIGSVTLASAAANLTLEVGMNGIQGVDVNGDVSPEFAVVFGAETDTPLCAVDQRETGSESPDARLEPGLFSDANGNISGSYLQTSDAELRLDVGALAVHKPWEVSEEARLAGALHIGLDGYQDPTLRGTVDRIPLLEAGAVTGTFDSIKLDGVLWNSDDLMPNGSYHAGDGLFRSLDYSDVAIMLSNYAALDGDIDGNRAVGFSDFLRLSRNFGSPGVWTDGDLTGNGSVEFADFLVLAQSFGTTAALSSVSVPEPRAGSLWLVGGIWFLLLIRRK